MRFGAPSLTALHSMPEEIAEHALELLSRVDSETLSTVNGLLVYRLRDSGGSGHGGSLMISKSEPRTFTFSLTTQGARGMRTLDPECEARLQLSYRPGAAEGLECKALVRSELDHSPEIAQALMDSQGVTLGGFFEAVAGRTTWRPITMRTRLDNSGEPQWETAVGDPVGLTPAPLQGGIGQDLALALAALR